jgi:hypothetical protein
MIWDKIKLAGAIIGAVTVIITSVFGAYSFFTKKIIASDRKIQSDIVLEKKVDMLIKIDSTRTLQFEKVIDTLNLIVKNQVASIKQVTKLNTAFAKHLKQTDRIEELLNWYEQ